MESDNQSNQSRERSIPITTTQGNMTTTHFPLSSSSSYSGASSPFNSARNDIFNQFHQFRKNQHPDEMFSDRPFSSLNHPSMNLASRHGDFFSHGHKDETDSGQPKSHQPRIFNIPIQVETAEGVVPLSRTNSHSPGSSQYRNQSYHASPTPGGGPIGSASSSPVPERVGEQSRQRPGPSPTPPPKPKFIPSFKPEAQSYAQPNHSQLHRVHTIPVKLEKDCKPDDSMPYTPNQNEEVRQTVPVPDQKASDEARFGRDSPDSQQSGGPHVVNIPINLESSQSGESKSKMPDRPGSGQSKPIGNVRKDPFDSLDLVRNVEEETCRLEQEVMEFTGEGQDKNYRFLDEMLTRCMLKLDNIDSHGRDDVRSARKSALAHVDRVIAILESKVSKSQTVESQIETLADKIETECSMQQSSDAASSMESEPEEAHKQEMSEIPESATGHINDTDEMEIESGSGQSKKTSDEQVDTQDEETNDEAIEEDPAGDDGLSKDFNNYNNFQPSNKNICRTTEEVIIEEMDKEESPAGSYKMRCGEADSRKAFNEIDSMRQDALDTFELQASHSNEPKVDLPPDDQSDDPYNNVIKEPMDIEIDSMDSCEDLVNSKSGKLSIEITSADMDGSNVSDDVDIQPYVELPDDSPAPSPLPSNDCEQNNLKVQIIEESSNNLKSSAKSLYAS